MPEPITIPLSRPITSVDTTFTQLSVREPTGEDLMRSGDSEEGIRFLLRIGARCANITMAAVETMAGRDALALTKAINSFLEPTSPEPAQPAS